jgi:hypothetical protein
MFVNRFACTAGKYCLSQRGDRKLDATFYSCQTRDRCPTKRKQFAEAGYVDLALGAPVFSDSTYLPGGQHSSLLCTDGNLDTFWASQLFPTPAASSDVTLQIKLSNRKFSV